MHRHTAARFLLLLVLWWTAVPAGAVRPHIWTIVDAIRDYGELHSSCVYRGCVQSEQWKRYLHLKSEATDDELLDLTDYIDPVVRCYAFIALVERGHPDVFPVLMRHVEDTDTLSAQKGCIGFPTTVRHVLFNAVTHGSFLDDIRKPSTLPPHQRAVVDSLAVLLTPMLLNIRR